MEAGAVGMVCALTSHGLACSRAGVRGAILEKQETTLNVQMIWRSCVSVKGPSARR